MFFNDIKTLFHGGEGFYSFLSAEKYGGTKKMIIFVPRY
jgi:hypothetical protein